MIRGTAFAAAIVGAIGALIVAIALQVSRDRQYPRDDQQRRSVLYVRSGPALRRIALEFDALAADVYWIRAIQHYGGDTIAGPTKKNRYELLYPLLDLATSLDPYFKIAYQFGAIFLSEGYPKGPGRLDHAIELLKKGIRAQPTKWQYYHDVAFIYYWHLRDMEAAARWFRMAAAQPTAPNWLEPMAAAVLVEGGDRASARFLLREILKSEEAWLRRMAARGLMQVDALDLIDQAHVLVRRFPPPEGTPYSWDWLVRRGVLARVPDDPSGTPFEMDPRTGEVRVSERSELHPMPKRKTR
jgi:tetratricopeptide (TPR) repeat protein